VTRKQYREHKALMEAQRARTEAQTARMDAHFARVDAKFAEEREQRRADSEEGREYLRKQSIESAKHTDALVLMLERTNEIATISARQQAEWLAESEAHRAALWAMIDRLGSGGPPPASTG
jgi:hypothetical protein